MNRRDAVNEILLSLNEMPLDIEDSVEDIQTAKIVDSQLEITKRNILSQGWFFNTTTRDLKPDLSGYIPLPSTFLSVDGGDNYSNVVTRDQKLFDKSELTYKFDEPIECVVIEDIYFDDIPFVIADYIVKSASLSSYINIIGNTDDVAIRSQLVQLSKLEAIRENARNYDGNILDSSFVTTLLDRESL
jgi:hypothetical protein